ncbi:hypothetical protein [Mesorhizobium caraganae]|uniref:hypothetical protein n=1 Tax=Mesorhizobium caraganae TaxID=483206 RepID=UPI00177EF3C6|nr:hypothetical protein [Mesorhizobium caraganae]
MAVHTADPGNGRVVTVDHGDYCAVARQRRQQALDVTHRAGRSALTGRFDSLR